MKKSWIRAQHKWVGLLLAFFMINFAWSGIVLNHRELFGGCAVSRRLLPSDYHLDHWSGGLLRGTYAEGDTVLLYGAAGIYRSDRSGEAMSRFDEGLPPVGDRHTVRGVGRATDGTLYAVATYGLYRLEEGDRWREVPLERAKEERLEDLVIHGDSTIVVSRSALYLSSGAGAPFVRTLLPAARDFKPETSAILTLFKVHSGAILGLPGRLLVDLAAVVLLFLSLTGIVALVLGYVIKWRKKHRRGDLSTPRERLAWVSSKHGRWGILALPLILFVVLSGWLLRPPLMIPFAYLSTEDHLAQPWQGKLRSLRYDDRAGEWLLYSSYGFFHTPELTTPAVEIEEAPPVSVMGLNCWDRQPDGRWVVGSFAGAYSWDYGADSVSVYGTEEAVRRGGMPIFGRAVSGYSRDFDGEPFLVGYGKGTDRLRQPEELRYLPMSLWNVALEVHVGRIYTVFGSAGAFFIFFAGLLSLWCILTGIPLVRKIRLRRRGKSRR